MRIFLPCFFIAYLLVLHTVRVTSFKKKYGIDPRMVRKSDPILYLSQLYRNVLFAAILVVVFVYALSPRLYEHVVPIPYMNAPAMRFAGVVLLVTSLVLVRLAQHQLGGSWRVGVDRSGSPTELITTGMYGRSRNPNAVGLTLTAVGLFLALPNAVTFAIANLTLLLVQVRVRVEEEHLLKMHGAAYQAYRQRIPRWLPRIGAEP